jgi:hypothetical protein
MAQKSGSSHPIAQRNVKNAQFSRVFVEFLWDDCENKTIRYRLNMEKMNKDGETAGRKQAAGAARRQFLCRIA